jgi:hypothetical protein
MLDDPHQPQSVLIARPALKVEVHRLEKGADVFLAAILDGHPLGEAASAAFTASDGFDLPAALALLVASGAVTSLKVE